MSSPHNSPFKLSLLLGLKLWEEIQDTWFLVDPRVTQEPTKLPKHRDTALALLSDASSASRSHSECGSQVASVEPPGDIQKVVYLLEVPLAFCTAPPIV